MSYGLLFSGQGTQHARMLRWVSDDDALVRQTNALLGVADWRRALDDADWAARNAHAQVFLTGIGLAAWSQLSVALPPPAAIAGYSVGELAAFAAAGVLNPSEAIVLARDRAAAMDRCAVHSPGGLLAVGGLPATAVEALCAGRPLTVAIRNSPSAVVLGGPAPALDEAMAPLLAAGARCVRLNVEVASHTPSMQAASVEFAALLATRALHPPRVPLFSSTADRVFSAAAAAEALAAQISHTLRWDECLENLQARRVTCVLEIGPGSALASMWNQRFPEIPARSADEFEDGDAIVAWIERHAS